MKLKHISDYKIDLKGFNKVKEINRGASGIVYEVINIETKKKYVAKILLSGSSENLKKMIDREVNILIRASHPTIIGFCGYSLIDFSDNKNFTILMNFAEKGSLQDILTQDFKLEGCDNTTKQIILIGIAYGMMFLHQMNIIHRDLKPGNILIDENFNPKISYFGLSKFNKLNKSSDQSMFGGTPEYMAPEIIKGEKYNGKVDVYSFGIIMYCIVTGKSPYPDFEKKKISLYQFHKMVSEEDYRPSFDGITIKKSLKNLIEKCWAPLPSDRPTFEEIFNKLAYNHEFSVYGIYSSDDEKIVNNKYYLDDVNYDRIFSYIDYIIKSKEENSIQEIISKMKEEIKNNNQNILELNTKIQDLENKNQKQSQQIQELVYKNKNLELQVQNITKQEAILSQKNSELQRVQKSNTNRFNDKCLSIGSNNNKEVKQIEIKDRSLITVVIIKIIDFM